MPTAPEVDQDQNTDEASGITKSTITISEEISKRLILDLEIGKTDDDAKEAELGLIVRF